MDTNDNPDYLGSGLLLKRAIAKFGKSNFIKEVLEIVDTKERLSEREKFWICHFDSTNKKIGYNISKGGSGGDCITHNPNKDLIKKKLSESLKRGWDEGKRERRRNLEDDIRNKISYSVKDRWKDNEYKEKVLLNREKALSEGRGRKSAEEIKKQKERQSKKVYQYSYDLVLIAIWDSQQSVKKFFGRKILKRWKLKYLDKDISMMGYYWKSS